jgi:hypothetical protein
VLRFRKVKSIAAAAACGLAVTGIGGLAVASPASAQVVLSAQEHQAASSAPAADTNKTYSLTDRCGGVNGHVVWYGDHVQIYGDVWENPVSCGGSGTHSVWLSFDYAQPVPPFIYNENWNHGYGYAGPGQTVGFNSGTVDSPSGYGVSDITVTLCSTEGGWHCGPAQSF